jgi:putative ABC transport system permease protein
MVSGFFPALGLSAWRPAAILRSGFGGVRQHSGRLQAVLVTLQFAISSTLVITTLVVLLQQIFVEDKDLGYTMAHKLVIRNLDQAASVSNREVFAAEVEQLPGVLGTTFSTATPGDSTGASYYLNVNLAGYQDEIFPLYPKAIDADFFDVYDIPVIKGRGFSAELRSDQFFWPAGSAANSTQMRSAAIVNTAAMRAAGFANADDALGSIIQMPGTDLEIIGVVPDVNFLSLRSAITPNMYIYSPEENFPALTVSYADGVNEQVLLGEITEVWDELFPAFPLEFDFVEDNVRAQYTQERLQFLLITIFSSLAISIACLGLYALASYSTRQRTREIGIRKVHGAMSTDILQIFLLQFSRPVVMANFLAWPVAWYVMDRYLSGFEYRINLGPSIFILASLATIIIAWSAIILHVAKVARSRPVNALRYC